MTTNQIGVIAAVLVTVVLIFSSFVIVDSGRVGVVRTLGAVQPEALKEGFHFKKPFVDSVEQIDVRLRKAENEAGAASKDLQVVRTRVAVQYSLTADVTPLTFQKIGPRSIVETTLINPAIMESVKAVTALYTAEELVTSRAEVKNNIQAAIENFINTTLEQKGVAGAMSLANVAITDFDFSKNSTGPLKKK